MKIALAAVGLVNSDIGYNKNTIVRILKEYSTKADLVLFGESFLQGFDSLTFDYNHDADVAVPACSEVIEEIRASAQKYGIAVSFGFFEKDGDVIYSSQITFDAHGNAIDLYRRVSEGWKEYWKTDSHYQEGSAFQAFEFYGKKLVVALCGDLWYSENLRKVKDIKPDVVLWPVYTDFNADTWNTREKHNYAKQVESIQTDVLYVNSFRLDNLCEETACGGAAHFCKGNVVEEVSCGSQNILIVTLPS